MTNDREATKVCAHKACTCHTQNGAEFCSDKCRQADQRMSADSCTCGHAGCAASEYTVPASNRNENRAMR